MLKNYLNMYIDTWIQLNANQTALMFFRQIWTLHNWESDIHINIWWCEYLICDEYSDYIWFNLTNWFSDEWYCNSRWDKYDNKYKELISENILTQINESELWYVYMLKTWGYYKIWISNNFKRRFKKYVTENPNEVEVIFALQVYWYKKIEWKIKEYFIDKRHRGEWFNFSEEDIVAIKQSLIIQDYDFYESYFWPKIFDSWMNLYDAQFISQLWH